MQGKSLYTILISIIAVLTLALAVMAIFLFTTNGGNNGANTVVVVTSRSVPPEEQAEFNLYAVNASGEVDTSKSGDSVFNIKNPNNFLMASVSIIYDGGKENKLLEKHKKLLQVVYLSELKQAAIEYFRGKTLEELQQSDAVQVACQDLKATFSSIVSDNPNEKIILKVILDKWILQ